MTKEHQRQPQHGDGAGRRLEKAGDVMKPAQVAVLLELVSYFLVTLDLFGTERLKRFQVRTESLFTAIREFDTESVIVSLLFIPNAVRSYVDPIFIGVLSFLLLITNVDKIITLDLPFRILLCAVISAFLAYYFDLVIKIILYILRTFIMLSIDFGLWLLRKQKVQGVMLSVGTLLFVIGKLIQFIDTAS